MEKLKLYNELLNQKKQGEKLNFDKITYDELYQLWGIEDVSDSALAKLFDVSINKIKQKRYKWNINLHTIGLNEINKKISKELSIISLEIKNAITSKKVEDIINQIEKLSEQEVNSIINYLIKNNKEMAIIAKHARQYRAVINAHKKEIEE